MDIEHAPSEMEQDSLEELTSLGERSGLEAEKLDLDGSKKPFDPEKIDVVTQARTIDLLLTRLREGELDLSPDFQRRSNLWDKSRKSSLIESMLLRIPIPSLYVSEDHTGNYTVVDGLQRLCAIAHFVDVAGLNKAVESKLDPLRLKDLRSLREHEDKTYDELPRALQRRISETELTLHIIRASTPSNVRFNIFSRINLGGLPLTSQEIRNAIYPGEWRKWISKLAKGDSFRKATEDKIKGERMEDLELVLRFVAMYSLSNKARPADENLDDFLNDTVEKQFPSWNEEKWTQVEIAFERAMIFAPKIFGPLAFRKFSLPNSPRRPINRGLFESESVALARRSDEELEVLASRSQQVIDKFAQKLEEEKKGFYYALLYATGKGEAANKRLETIESIFGEVFNA